MCVKTIKWYILFLLQFKKGYSLMIILHESLGYLGWHKGMVMNASVPQSRSLAFPLGKHLHYDIQTISYDSDRVPKYGHNNEL